MPEVVTEDTILYQEKSNICVLYSSKQPTQPFASTIFKI